MKHKNKIIKRNIVLSLLLCMTFVLSCCGSVRDEFLTLDVFAGRANYQGMQEGWYAKLAKDKFNLAFNIIAPNVSGGGNLLFETRLAAGKVGDIVITSMPNMQQCMNEDLLADLTPYIDKTKYLKNYKDAIVTMNRELGIAEGIYIIPTTMSTMPVTEPITHGDTLEFGSYLPWAYYKELGYPIIETEEDLIEVLAQMQANHPTTAEGKKTYGFSLFDDWDVDHMSLAAHMMKSYGYTMTTQSILTSGDYEKIMPLLADDSTYRRILKLYFMANQRGLLDPESGVQSFDTMNAKAQSGQVFYLWWAWMRGYSQDNYHMFVPISEEAVICDGYSTYGDGYAYAVGKNTKSVERVVEFLDWMVSPEGMMCYGAGYEGLGYEIKDGKPVYTEFSGQAWEKGYELAEEYGGGSYSQGYCQFNDSIVQQKDINPLLGEPYYSENWSTTIEMNRGEVHEQWSKFYGFQNPINYLKGNDLLQVQIKGDYVQETEDAELTMLRSNCGTLIKDYSWDMIFASSEEEFDRLWEDLKDLLYQNGYEKIEQRDMQIIEELRVSRAKALETK